MGIKIKYIDDDSIDRYKSRLVTKGYTQLDDIDYFDIFSPMDKLTIVRILLVLTSIKN